MESKEGTTSTMEGCCGGDEGSFDCGAMMQKMQSLFAGMFKEEGSCDCGAMMQKICCGTSEGSEQ